jgi:hypothetical protein
MELQRRGSMHWHLLLALPGVGGPDGGEAETVRCEWWALQVRRSWWAAVDRMGEYDDGAGVRSTRMALPGAEEHSAEVRFDFGNGEAAWLRYLRDHTSKRKQEQAADGCGRHWGVVGRARWVRAYPDDVMDLSAVEYSRMLRWLQRLCTPSIPCARSPFGRRLGYRLRRGRIGSSVWFTRPDTVRRAAEWAVRLSGEGQAAVTCAPRRRVSICSE